MPTSEFRVGEWSRCEALGLVKSVNIYEFKEVRFRYCSMWSVKLSTKPHNSLELFISNLPKNQIWRLRSQKISSETYKMFWNLSQFKFVRLRRQFKQNHSITLPLYSFNTVSKLLFINHDCCFVIQSGLAKIAKKSATVAVRLQYSVSRNYWEFVNTIATITISWQPI